MIPQSEIDQIRADAVHLLQGSCTILAKQSVSDGGGGHTETWVAALTDVPCRIAPIGGGVGPSVGERVSDESTHVVTLPAKTAVAKTSRIEVAESGLYEVTLIRTRTFDEYVRRVEVKEV